MLKLKFILINLSEKNPTIKKDQKKMKVKILLFKTTIKGTNLNLEIMRMIKVKLLIGTLT